MMKVGYIIAQKALLNSPIGYSVHIRSFAENFAKIGGEIFLIRKGKEKEKLKNVEIFDLRWITGPPKVQKFCDLLFNFRLYLSAQPIIKEKKPDILHERESYLNLSGLLLANKFRLPYVLEVNCPLMVEVRDSFPIYQKIHKAIQKKLFSRADKIIAVSKAIKSHLIDQNVPEEKIKVIPNGVDKDIFNPGISGLDVRRKYGLENKDIIVYAGSLHQDWQGIDDLLKSAEMLSSINPSLVFFIVGGTRAEITKIKAHAPSNVIFSGRVDQSRVPEYLAAADILVAPYKKAKDLGNISFYNSPIKLFEYMAMAKPIIASNIGQIGEILRHRKTGLLNEPGNPQELTECILLLLKDNNLKKELGSNSRLEVEKSYTWEQNARRIMEVYEKVLESKQI